MLASDVIREISVDLNDQVPGYEYTRWTVDQLAVYVREAAINTSLQVKDLFSKTMVVKVQPGGGWQEACSDCTYVTRIIGECDAAGNVLTYLSRSTDNELTTWAGPITRCPVDPRTYKMTGYSVSSTQLGQFKVFPPLKPGMVRYVLVECYNKPDTLSFVSDIPDELVPVIKQWALFRCYSNDTETNQAITQLGQTHYKVYTDLLTALVTERKERYAANNPVRTQPQQAAQ